MNIAIVIPARGGSKRIHNKNLQRLGQCSLLERCVQKCIDAYVGRVYVSTDDGEIAEVAGKAGACIIVRPPELSTDRSTTDSALVHAAKTVLPCDTDAVICVHCTSPFLKSTDITVATSLYRGHGCVMSVTPFHRFVWQKFDEDFKCINMRNRPMTQDWPPQYIETGMVHLVNMAQLIKHETRIVHPITPLVISEERCLDIDTYEDLEYARILEELGR